MIRRVEIVDEPELFHAVWHWDDGAPRWRKDCEAAWGVDSLEKFLAAAADPHRLNIGVFEGPELVGLIMLRLAAHSIYDVDIAAKRGASCTVLLEGARALTAQMFLQHQMTETFTFTPTCNRAIIRLLEQVGFRRDGVTILKGQTHGKVIEWEKRSIRRADLVFP